MEENLECIFCDDSKNTVQQSKRQSYITLKNAAFRRKDGVSAKFERMYSENLQKQSFSWHRMCYATYVSEEKIRRREIQLSKENIDNVQSKCNDEPSILDIPSTSYSLRQGQENETIRKCVICNQLKKSGTIETFVVSTRDSATKLQTSARSKLDDTVFTRMAMCSNC